MCTMLGKEYVLDSWNNKYVLYCDIHYMLAYWVLISPIVANDNQTNWPLLFTNS